MVRLHSGRLLYGDVSGQLNHEISKGGLIQYIMSKNLHWDDNIFKMIDWKGMGSTLGKMKDTEVTNILKMVHGWGIKQICLMRLMEIIYVLLCVESRRDGCIL